MAQSIHLLTELCNFFASKIYGLAELTNLVVSQFLDYEENKNYNY